MSHSTPFTTPESEYCKGDGDVSRFCHRGAGRARCIALSCPRWGASRLCTVRRLLEHLRVLDSNALQDSQRIAPADTTATTWTDDFLPISAELIVVRLVNP